MVELNLTNVLSYASNDQNFNPSKGNPIVLVTRKENITAVSIYLHVTLTLTG